MITIVVNNGFEALFITTFWCTCIALIILCLSYVTLHQNWYETIYIEISTETASCGIPDRTFEIPIDVNVEPKCGDIDMNDINSDRLQFAPQTGAGEELTVGVSVNTCTGYVVAWALKIW